MPGITLFTTRGHVITFEADKPTNVPNDLVPTALGIGAVDASEVAEAARAKKESARAKKEDE